MRKLYYSISEVCQLVDEEQHILRYWEKEFPQLKPKKNRGGNRIYSEKDVFLINSIKKLLRVEKIPLKNAKEQLSEKSYNLPDDGLFSSKLQEQSDDSPKTIEVIGKSSTEMVISKNEIKELLHLLRKFEKILFQSQ